MKHAFIFCLLCHTLQEAVFLLGKVLLTPRVAVLRLWRGQTEILAILLDKAVRCQAVDRGSARWGSRGRKANRGKAERPARSADRRPKKGAGAPRDSSTKLGLGGGALGPGRSGPGKKLGRGPLDREVKRLPATRGNERRPEQRAQ